MGKLHLNFAAPVAGPKIDPDQRRAELMTARFTEGLRTLDRANRWKVIDALVAEFCQDGR